ncbi:MAG: M20/M25/M40 family metallo-hydrolase [Candidatus Amulumruptor caecigallinarius]|nr:M20/M25/M40 family metallo-hydrolase [Candidatus Amulumruptor caecigallinarius]MCM1396103.1 M20/M25/M40 family metallo-hydrolase [Candidatus Amulumruptor caecigallinarius]MCM1453888.1 M20/M25/M40 family metallo-hydrolase [bacterium]
MSIPAAAARPIALLERMIATPSISRDEEAVSLLIADELAARGIRAERIGRNIVAGIESIDPAKPTLMLNSHIDTVKPAATYSFDPFTPQHRNGALYGLGSNDAGASVVSLIEVYDLLRAEPLPYNLLLAISAEEEVSGEGGMRMLLPALAERGIRPEAALVGEPTGMQPAVAEHGLIVLDCVTHGISGHAARTEGVNAIYRAMADIEALRNFRFPRESAELGPVKVTVTQIEAGRQHNVIPDECRWVVDVRTTDAHTNQETAELLAAAMSPHTTSAPRSTRLQASVIDRSHPLVTGAVALGRTPYVSPTMSDMALMWGIPSLKMGPGDSARSHTADEFIRYSEIAEAVELYTALLRGLRL